MSCSRERLQKKLYSIAQCKPAPGGQGSKVRDTLAMFDHAEFEQCDFSEVPTNRDVFVMSARDMAAYEAALLEFFETGEYPDAGQVAPVAVNEIGPDALYLSWYLVHDRFHETQLTLPRTAFVQCISIPRFDEKTRIFVDPEWLASLDRRTYSVFALIDAVGVADLLRAGQLRRDRLESLRDSLDSIGSRYPGVSLISFADSVLAKSNWWPGYAKEGTAYRYEPEVFLRLVADVDSAFQECLGLTTYAVITQGVNEYYDDALSHISEAGNHVSLNSLGLPFAQLQSIESAARSAIRRAAHSDAELYMDSTFYYSLRFDHRFDRYSLPRGSYTSKLVSPEAEYILASRDEIFRNLAASEPKDRPDSLTI